MFADISNYDERIRAGKNIELRILNALRLMGYKINPPTEQEDKYDKIDGWWITKKGNKYSLQIKFRQSGEDILFELVRNIDKNYPGRDILGKSQIYIVANTSGKTMFMLTKPIKDFSIKLLEKIKESLTINPSKKMWEGDKWVARVQYDRASGERKIVAYYDPSLFEILKVWNLNI